MKMDKKFISPEPMRDLVDYVEECVKYQKEIFVFEKQYLMSGRDAAKSSLDLYTLPKEVRMTEVRIFDQEPKVSESGHTQLSEARAQSYGRFVPLIERMSDLVRKIQVELILEKEIRPCMRNDTLRIYRLTPKIE